MRMVLGVLALGVALTAAAPARFGGWAVITVDSLPAALEVGRPVRLSFVVRQHGRTPLDDLEPTVSVTRDGTRERQQIRAIRGDGPGRYVATFTPTSVGAVRIAIDANWHDAKTELLPVPVVARGTSTAAAATPDRGRELFVAKGCVTCHMNRSDREVASRHVVDVGPELTGRTWPAEWLAAKLANPAAFASGAGNGIAMPSLGLSDVEIASLVGFLNRTPLTTAGH